jgi:hypothetical protein
VVVAPPLQPSNTDVSRLLAGGGNTFAGGNYQVADAGNIVTDAHVASATTQATALAATGTSTGANAAAAVNQAASVYVLNADSAGANASAGSGLPPILIPGGIDANGNLIEVPLASSTATTSTQSAPVSLSGVSLTDSNFWQSVSPALEGSGNVNFSQGSLQVGLFTDDADLVPVIRGNGQSLTQASIAFSGQQGGASNDVIDGEQFEFNGLLGSVSNKVGYGIANNTTLDPSDVTPIGQVVSDGSVVAGRSSPLTFYVAQVPNGADDSTFQFGVGNPPANSLIT